MKFDKSEVTIKGNTTKCAANKRHEMFDSLANAMVPKKAKSNPTAVLTRNNYNDIVVRDLEENLPSFDLEAVDDFETIYDEVLSMII